MRSNYWLRHYQERIEKIKAFIQMKESIEGRPVTDEDFKDSEAPCDSMPEVVHKDEHTYWRLDGDLYIDRTDEKLIPKETTFNELVQILSANPEVAANAETEREEQKAEQREAELREKFGEDYDLVFDKKKVDAGKSRRPGARVLRCVAPHVAVIECQNARLEVFSNGYAIYDNGNRQVVMWVLDCGSKTYYFTGLNDNQKEYLNQASEIGMDILGDLPWYHALTIAGEDRIELSMDHPKSVGSTSEFDLDEVDLKPATRWTGASHFDTPEEALMKKEAAEGIRRSVKQLRPKQRDAIQLCYFDGLTQEDAAQKLNIAQSTLSERVRNGEKALSESMKKIFYEIF